jgi:hypothetical protein
MVHTRPCQPSLFLWEITKGVRQIWAVISQKGAPTLSIFPIKGLCLVTVSLLRCPRTPSDQPSLQAGYQHQPISNRYYHSKGDDTTWYAPRQEMFDLKVALSGLRYLHHNSSYSSQVSDRHYKVQLAPGCTGGAVNLLIFGNPEVGKPIAAEHIRAPPMTSKFGCGSFMLAPTCCTSGKMINAATV